MPEYFTFSGPAGTGKSMAAKKLADALHTLGWRDGHTVAGGYQLVGETLEATRANTSALLDESRGGVLLIEDLGPLVLASSVSREAVATIVEALRNAQIPRVMIFAGHDKEIERLRTESPELGSCGERRVRFPSLTPEQLWQILQATATSRGFIVATSARDSFVEFAERLCSETRYGSLFKLIDLLGNARFARTVVDLAHQLSALRLTGRDLQTLSDAELFGINDDDLLAAAEQVAAPARRAGS